MLNWTREMSPQMVPDTTNSMRAACSIFIRAGMTISNCLTVFGRAKLVRKVGNASDEAHC